MTFKTIYIWDFKTYFWRYFRFNNCNFIVPIDGTPILYKALWRKPFYICVSITADKLLNSTNVFINGEEVTTDKYGNVKLGGYYGEDKSFYIKYGDGWTKAVTIRFGEKFSEIKLDPNFQWVTISKADGSLVKNKSITIGGQGYSTDGNGQVLLYGDYKTSKSLQFKLSNNDYVTKTITFNGGTTAVKLEAHVVAGSISASVWNFSSSSWTKNALTFTAPTYVKVMKITGSGFDGWSDEASEPAYVGTDGSANIGGGTVIFSGTGSFTKYLEVTPGKSYTLYGRWISGGSLSYSDDINKQTVNINLG